MSVSERQSVFERCQTHKQLQAKVNFKSIFDIELNSTKRTEFVCNPKLSI